VFVGLNRLPRWAQRLLAGVVAAIILFAAVAAPIWWLIPVDVAFVVFWIWTERRDAMRRV